MLLVVAAAIIVDGRVLAARRSSPPELAGGWEFPGGKIEADESPTQALTRECSEELGVTIRAGAYLGTATDQVELHLYAADLVAGAPTPLQDHDELRWLGRAELGDIAWLPVDLALLDVVGALLR